MKIAKTFTSFVQEWLTNGGMFILVQSYILFQFLIVCYATYSLNLWIYFLPIYISILLASTFEFALLKRVNQRVATKLFQKKGIIDKDEIVEGSKVIFDIPNIVDDKKYLYKVKDWHPFAQKQCEECNKESSEIRPPRCRHCHVCDECRYGFDHHCIFVDACIDETNYPAFVCFLIWSFSGLALQKLVEVGIIIAGVIYAGKDYDTPEYLFLSLWIKEETLVLFGDNTFVILIVVDFLTGVLIASLILSLLVDQIQNMSKNATCGEETKYGMRGWNKTQPFDFSRVYGRKILGFYLNLRYRVWKGPLIEQNRRAIYDNFFNDMSVFTSDKSWKRDLWKTFKEIFHTLACFTLPLWWRLSGEYSAHVDYRIVSKYCNIPNEQEWSKQFEFEEY